jgi:uncharacterized protein YdhG (YjbR/CyaY superfamily)
MTMDNKTNLPESIDAYIAQFPAEIREKLQQIRVVIKQAAPDASEKISYQMPTFYLHGNLVHFAAFKQHIGFYPAPSGIENFSEELAAYKTSKGAIQFPLDQPIPFDLVRAIVEFRVAENLKSWVNKSAVKSKGKK